MLMSDSAVWYVAILVSSFIAAGSGFSLNTETPRQRCITQHHVLQSTSTSLNTDAAVELEMMEFSKQETYDEPPVVLLHGLLGSKRNFASLGSSLAIQLKKKRRVMAVDLRNHGENHHDWRHDMSYREMAMDVLRVLDSQDIKQAVLVGHSMGGKVAQALALLEPDRVAGLVVLDIAPVQYTEKDPNWRIVHDIIRGLNSLEFQEGQTKRDVDVMLRPVVEDPALRAFVLTNLNVGNNDPVPSWKINMKAIFRQMDVLAGFSSVEGEYGGDVLIIHGGQSRFVRSTHMESIQSYFPNHMLTTIKGAGHWVHAEAPDDTLALLKRYLDR